MYIELARLKLNDVSGYIKEIFPDARGFFIAGGAVRDLLIGETPKDYDVFFKRHKDALHFLKTYTTYLESSNVTLLCITKNAITIELPKKNFIKIQFIINKEFCRSPEQTVKRFDFKCCMVYYDFNQVSFYTDLVRHEIILRRLTFNKQCYRPVQSIRRMYKFRSRGWDISSSEFIKVMWYAWQKSSIKDIVRSVVVKNGGY